MKHLRVSPVPNQNNHTRHIECIRICRMHVWLHGKATSHCSGRHCWILGRIAAALLFLWIFLMMHAFFDILIINCRLCWIIIYLVYIKTIIFYYICNELIMYQTLLSPNFTFGCRQVHTLGQVASLNTEHTLSLNIAGGQQKTLSRLKHGCAMLLCDPWCFALLSSAS